MYTGPKLTNNNLVFGYDTGYGIANAALPTRFFKGKPTTNLASGLVKTFNSWSNLQGQTDYYTREGSQGVFLQVTTSGGVQWHGSNQINNVSSSTVYTISATIKWTGVTPHTNLFYVRQYNASSNQVVEGGHFSTSYMIDLGDGWYRAYRTFTTTSTTTYLRIQGYQYSANANIYYQDEQLELGGQLTPYPGDGATRSNTASLIDLTKATDLTLSAISYDSTGQPDYDGTDDYINLGDYAPIRLGTNFTIECVVRPEEDKWMYFFWKGYGSNNSLAWGRHSSGDNWFFSTMINGAYQNSYMGTATLNKYCHLVATYDGANLRLYENGDLKTTSAKTHDMLTSSSPAGIGGPSRYWNGKIPVTKIYSKVLTTEEVVSNFNAYKNRFNI